VFATGQAAAQSNREASNTTVDARYRLSGVTIEARFAQSPWDKLPDLLKTGRIDLVLNGYIAFLDPPKDTCTAALKQLGRLSVDVKILTGDNEIVTAFICKEVGIPAEHILLGSKIETMSEADLAEAARTTTVFARLVPAHKERIIRALQSTGHVTTRSSVNAPVDVSVVISSAERTL
jgi:magnesium-transporting ATPase (P-type)